MEVISAKTLILCYGLIIGVNCIIPLKHQDKILKTEAQVERLSQTSTPQQKLEGSFIETVSTTVIPSSVNVSVSDEAVFTISAENEASDDKTIFQVSHLMLSSADTNSEGISLSKYPGSDLKEKYSSKLEASPPAKTVESVSSNLTDVLLFSTIDNKMASTKSFISYTPDFKPSILLEVDASKSPSTLAESEKENGYHSSSLAETTSTESTTSSLSSLHPTKEANITHSSTEYSSAVTSETALTHIIASSSKDDVESVSFKLLTDSSSPDSSFNVTQRFRTSHFYSSTNASKQTDVDESSTHFATDYSGSSTKVTVSTMQAHSTGSSDFGKDKSHFRWSSPSPVTLVPAKVGKVKVAVSLTFLMLALLAAAALIVYTIRSKKNQIQYDELKLLP